MFTGWSAVWHLSKYTVCWCSNLTLHAMIRLPKAKHNFTHSIIRKLISYILFSLLIFCSNLASQLIYSDFRPEFSPIILKSSHLNRSRPVWVLHDWSASFEEVKSQPRKTSRGQMHINQHYCITHLCTYATLSTNAKFHPKSQGRYPQKRNQS